MKIHFKIIAALVISGFGVVSCNNTPKIDYVLKGDEAYHNHNYEAAIFNYKQAIKLDSSNAVVYFKKGVVENIISDYKSALYDLSKAISISPQMHDAYFFRGQVKDFTDDTSGAIKDYTKAIELNDGDMDSYYARGLDEEKIYNNTSALKDYERIIQINPLSEMGSRLISSARWRRGLVEIRMNDLKPAQEDFETVLKSSPDDRSALEGMAELEDKLNNKQKAIDYYKDASKCCHMKWQRVDSLYYVARVKDLEGKPKEAIELYNKAIIKNRFYSECYNARGADEILLNKCNMAINDLDSAIKYNSHYAEAYNNRAIAYQKSGKKDSSKVDFERAQHYGYKME